MRWGLSSKYYGIVAAYIILAPYVQADISGKVFRDFNANGVFDTGGNFNEVGQAGVTVKAFDAAGVEKSSVTSAADGSYILTGLASGADYRVEFSWTESWLKPSAAGGTSVQFASDGATDVNAALSNPAQYCQTNPNVSITRIVPDDKTSKPTVLSFAYNSTGDDRSAMTEFTHGSDQLGTLWGTAYRRDTKKLYTSAVLRRHASEGSLGFGGIYEIDTANPTANPVAWLTLPDAGVMSTARGIPTNGDPNHDVEAYQKVGKMSIGDIDISDDGKTLYAMNLNNRSLVPIDIDSKTVGTAIPVGNPGCSSANDVRPWAVKVYEGNVYVGVVCSNESVGSITSEFKAHVMKLNGSNFTTVASMPLDYEKNWAAPGRWDNKAACEPMRGWFPWASDPALFTSFAGCRADLPTVALHPQPILSDIEFDVDGSIILGLLDRFSMQVGGNNYAPDANSTTTYGGFAGGDIRRICNVAGSYVAEGGTGCAFNGGQQLSGFNEFYVGDEIRYSWDGQVSSIESAHSETALGGLALQAGMGTVLTNVYDPLDDLDAGNDRWGTQGVRWLSNTNGSMVNSFEVVSIADQDLGKVAGVGDLELLCDEPPIEIGNRVWLDADKDGIQDAGETGIDGVAVVLTCGANTATTTSANGGQYLFSSTGNASFMKAGESCTISIAANQASLNGLSVTAQNQDGLTNNHAVTDVRDSDANPDGSISFTLGAAGENNHGLDIGYTSKPTITYSAVSGPEPMTCTSDVRLATSVNVNGDSQAAGSTGAGFNSLVTFDYATTGVLTTPYSAATAGQLGAVWGLAYDSVRKKLYTSAFLKRHTSFGPNGSGAIYQMDTQSATATPSLLIDLAANGVDVGGDPRTVSDGTVDAPDELPIDGTKPSWDQTAFAQIAKISIGDIDMSADGNTLWAINLKQRELVAVNLTNKTVGAKLAIPNPGCSQGDYRPWALKLHLGKAWIGTVCSAEQSQVAADLKAYVQVFDGSSFSNAFELPLDYTKGNVGNGPGAEKWQPWLTSYQTLATDPKFAIYPQPILSDIEFDMDGSMILGFMDRMGHQVGSNNYTPNHPDTSLIQGQTGGDILRVCNNNGVYTLESNATCSSGSTKGKDNAQGPNGGEYYWGDMWDYNPWNAQGGYHQETSFGGLAFKAGSGELAVTAMNPLTPNAVAGGIIWLDNATGGQSTQHAEGTQLYQQAANNPYFGKAAGMGDVEIFCAEAAILPDLKLVKEVSKSTGKRGETVSYTLILTNESSATASNVSVQDILPQQLFYISQNGDGTYDPLTGAWAVGDVSGASTKQLTITATIK